MKFLILLLTSLPLTAAVGCLDNSYHMVHERYYESVDPSLRAGLRPYHDEEGSRPADTKSWHPVACTCPCNGYHAKYLNRTNGAYGFCVKCRHRGPVCRRNRVEVSTDDIEIKEAFINRWRKKREELPQSFAFSMPRLNSFLQP